MATDTGNLYSIYHLKVIYFVMNREKKNGMDTITPHTVEG